MIQSHPVIVIIQSLVKEYKGYKSKKKSNVHVSCDFGECPAENPIQGHDQETNYNWNDCVHYFPWRLLLTPQTNHQQHPPHSLSCTGISNSCKPQRKELKN
eukprot:TRINITY_DN1777_c0_g1_i3.p2 TRINITY_DN1777_c0_g1~~TRINITY_DN1777_c0_g1_i3.p2  ORF type:complete len:101 (+),score=19.44 TRINITY_DN1777_c0_g1_i3:204-506(+)